MDHFEAGCIITYSVLYTAKLYIFDMVCVIIFKVYCSHKLLEVFVPTKSKSTQSIVTKSELYSSVLHS